MREKKGQLTLFIIVAVFIVFGIVLAVFLNKVEKKTDSPTSFSGEVFREVEDCIELSVRTAIYFNFLQGGYNEVLKPKISYYPIEIPLYFNSSKSSMPSIQIIERELDKTVKSELIYCMDDALLEDLEVISKVLENEIFFKFNILTKAIEQDKTMIREEFEYVVNIDFKEKYDLISLYIDEQEKDSRYFLIGNLANVAIENNFSFDILEIDKETKVISIILDELDERGNVIYNFGVRNENVE